MGVKVSLSLYGKTKAEGVWECGDEDILA